MGVFDDDGNQAYTEDGRNHVYYADGAVVPDGYAPVLVDDPSKPRFKTFDFRVNGNLTLVEETADGGTAQEVIVDVSELSHDVKVNLRNALKALADEMGATKPAAE